MRLIPYSWIALWFLIATPAHAQLSGKIPDATDTEGWNGYCGGMEQEISRQAVEGNNQLQFQETERRRVNLRAELTYFLMTKEWAGQNWKYWVEQGGHVAGDQFWDVGQLTNGDNADRAAIRTTRRNNLSYCDQLADTAVIYTLVK